MTTVIDISGVNNVCQNLLTYGTKSEGGKIRFFFSLFFCPYETD